MWAAPRWLFPHRNRSCFLIRKANRAGEVYIRLPAGAGDCRLKHQGTSRWKSLKEGSSRWIQQQGLITLEHWNSFFPQILHILSRYQQQGAWLNRTDFPIAFLFHLPPCRRYIWWCLGTGGSPSFAVLSLRQKMLLNSRFHWAWFQVKQL